MEAFKTYRAVTREEVLEYIKRYGEECRIIAGGTDIIIALKHDREKPKYLLDISNVKDFKFIKECIGNIEIGSASTFANIRNCSIFDSRLKGLKSAAESIGSSQIRNRGTVGGNICNAAAAADMVPMLIALGSTAVIESVDNTRMVKVEDIFRGKGQVDLKRDEVLTKVIFKNPVMNQGTGFAKLGKRNALAIARVSIGVLLERDEIKKCKKIRVSSGAVGLHAMREREIEDYVTDRILNEITISEACCLLETIILKRLGDRPTAGFKSSAVKGIFRDALSMAIDSCIMGGLA